MTILFLEWNSYCKEDMITAFEKAGHNVIRFPFSDRCEDEEYFTEERFEEALKKHPADFVFSFNYFPPVSACCQKNGVRYVAWVYDSPYVNLYSFTLINSCNYVFLFDRTQYLEFKNQGINTVYYLPMAVNMERLEKIVPSPQVQKMLDADVAFVGSLYREEKHNLYARFDGVSPYVKGYLDGIIQAQLKVYGYNFLQEMLQKDILEEMKRVHHFPTSEWGVETEEFLYGDYVLSREVTALERRQILEMLSENYKVQLHTNDKNVQIGKVHNMGPTDYYNGMPYVFKTAKINLNITLRSIRTGIPLRAMDIMGCGGFLLTNYQEELMDYFVPDEDFVYYTDYRDLMRKVEYYLQHDEEREAIAKNGMAKMAQDHTFDVRVQMMLEVVAETDGSY